MLMIYNEKGQPKKVQLKSILNSIGNTANLVVNYLDKVFGTRMLALKSLRGVSWAPHSPDLNPLDYFVWGYLKSLVYKPMPKDLSTLKERVKTECNRLSNELIRKAVFSEKIRATLCVKAKGKGIEGKKII